MRLLRGLVRLGCVWRRLTHCTLSHVSVLGPDEPPRAGHLLLRDQEGGLLHLSRHQGPLQAGEESPDSPTSPADEAAGTDTSFPRSPLVGRSHAARLPAARVWGALAARGQGQVAAPLAVAVPRFGAVGGVEVGGGGQQPRQLAPNDVVRLLESDVARRLAPRDARVLPGGLDLERQRARGGRAARAGGDPRGGEPARR